MDSTYRPGIGQRLINIPFTWLVGRGFGADYRYILSVPGRITGKRMSTPIDVMTRGTRRYLISGHGETNWVRNARSAGQVELSRRGRSERLAVHELAPSDAASILRQYVEQVPIMRGQFAARYTDPSDSFLPEAAQHPVFELVAVAS